MGHTVVMPSGPDFQKCGIAAYWLGILTAAVPQGMLIPVGRTFVVDSALARNWKRMAAIELWQVQFLWDIGRRGF